MTSYQYGTYLHEKVLEVLIKKTGGRKLPLIFVVEDEPGILELVSVHLDKSGFRVTGFENATTFLKSLNAQIPDLIILDLMLPDADGFEICKSLKRNEEFSNIPIIMLTARGEETDRVLGLELGADDYVTKPFSLRELIARVKAVLRRKERREETKKIEVGEMVLIDPLTYEVFVEEKKVELTPTEFRILKILAERKGWVFTRNQILEELWGGDKDVFDRTVDAHIKNLRKKLGRAGRFIKSVRGIGYKLEI